MLHVPRRTLRLSPLSRKGARGSRAQQTARPSIKVSVIGPEVTVTSSTGPVFAEVATKGVFAREDAPDAFDQPSYDVSAHAEQEGRSHHPSR